MRKIGDTLTNGMVVYQRWGYDGVDFEEEAKDLIDDDELWDNIRAYLACHSCGHSPLTDEEIRKKIDDKKNKKEFIEKLSEDMMNSEIFWEFHNDYLQEDFSQMIRERWSWHGFLISRKDQDDILWQPYNLDTKETIIQDFFNTIWFKQGWREGPDDFDINCYPVYTKTGKFHDSGREIYEPNPHASRDFELSSWNHTWYIEPLSHVEATIYDLKNPDAYCGISEWNYQDGEIWINGEAVAHTWPFIQENSYDNHYDPDIPNEFLYTHEAAKPSMFGYTLPVVKVEEAQEDEDQFVNPGIYYRFKDIESLARFHVTGTVTGTIPKPGYLKRENQWGETITTKKCA